MICFFRSLHEGRKNREIQENEQRLKSTNRADLILLMVKPEAIFLLLTYNIR